MNTKYFKNIFIGVIIILIIIGIYVIYIKDNKNEKGVQAKTKETQTTKEIAIGITEFDTINPILTKSLEIQHITKLIYEPLIDITQDFNVKPAIAEQWSELDRLTYIIKLDETKRWKNGENVTVEDIIFTINAINSSNSIYKKNVESIKEIEKVDETTFKIYLKQEVDFFEYLLCFPIMQEKSYNSEIPMGTGEYSIQSSDEKNIIIQGKETKLIVKIYNTISELYNNFTRENVDLIITQNTSYEEHIGNIGFEESIITGREFYYISLENIKKKELRHFFNNSINRDKLIYDLYNNKYKSASFSLDYGSYLNNENTKENQVNINISKTYTLSVENENYEIADKIKEQLEEKGINIKIQKYKNTKADLILKSKTVSLTPDIIEFFNNEEIKLKIQEIQKIESKEIMQKEYYKIIDTYYEEMPFISLYFNSYIILHNSNLKGDFSGNWYNMFYNIDTWYKLI